jgi:hypothetical protein
MFQLDLFQSSSPPSSAPLPTSPIMGQRVRLPDACRCGSYTGVIGSSSGPHEHRLCCERCDTWRRWLSRAEAAFIMEVGVRFGAPAASAVRRRAL